MPVGLLLGGELIPLVACDHDLVDHEVVQGQLGIGVEVEYDGEVAVRLDGLHHVQQIRPGVHALVGGVIAGSGAQQPVIGPLHVLGHQLTAVVRLLVLEVHVLPQLDGEVAILKGVAVGDLAGHPLHGQVFAGVDLTAVLPGPVDAEQRLIPQVVVAHVGYRGVVVVIELLEIDSQIAAVLGFRAGGGRGGALRIGRGWVLGISPGCIGPARRGAAAGRQGQSHGQGQQQAGEASCFFTFHSLLHSFFMSTAGAVQASARV